MSNTREFIVRDAQGVVTPLYVRSGNVVTPVVTVSSTGDVTQELQAGAFYKFGTIDSLTITLALGNTPLDGTTPLLVYGGKFTAASASTSLNLPATVTVADSVPDIEANHVYEFNIADGVLLMVDVTAQSA